MKTLCFSLRRSARGWENRRRLGKTSGSALSMSRLLLLLTVRNAVSCFLIPQSIELARWHVPVTSAGHTRVAVIKFLSEKWQRVCQTKSARENTRIISLRQRGCCSLCVASSGNKCLIIAAELDDNALTFGSKFYSTRCKLVRVNQ